MRFSTRPVFLAFLSAAALAAPSIARADVHGWTLCTPSSFHSCHSVAIGTVPIMTGSVRTGTGITISLTNLQGSGYASDNTAFSGLYRVFFGGRNFPLPMTFSLLPYNGTPTGGASGSANWYMETGVQPGSQGTVHYVDASPNGNGIIGGCSSGTLAFGLTQSAKTCGAAQSVVFNFTTGNIFDAGQMETVFIQAFGAPDTFDYCFSDPSAAPDAGFPTCDVQDEYLTTVTPEPISMALLGTGLFGIGGARLRRRKKTSEV
jgi:hypothetical protein